MKPKTRIQMEVEQNNTNVESIPIVMVRPNLDGIPDYPLGKGYRIRTYDAKVAERWVDIQAEVGGFASAEAAWERYNHEFAPFPEVMADRCIFVETAEGEVVGTATAWFNASYEGEDYGRLHWVAIKERFQGKGLAKPLISAALQRLAESHGKAYLTSQTTSYKAINIYLDFGFVPYIVSDRCKEAWAMLEQLLQRRIDIFHANNN